jgi:hypothetical protein
MSHRSSRRLAPPPALATLLCLLGLLGLLAGGVHAQTLYQVELVVFARDSAEAEIEESWQRDHGLRYPKRLVGLAPVADGADPSQPAIPFQLLPASARKLNDSARALDRRSNLRVLFHGAWVQPAAGIDNADPVLITGGSRYGDHSELEGYVVLTVERYLHLRADLWMTRFGTGSALDVDVPVLPTPVVTVGTAADGNNPGGGEQATGTGPATAPATIGYIPERIYTLDQERRMRLGELHYIDHPRFGLLVQVSPYTPPAPPAPAAPVAPTETPVISTAPAP